MMIGVSACLLGYNCTYKQSNHLINGLKMLYDQGKVVCVCPEVLGGLTIPRSPAEIQCMNPLQIINQDEIDVTDAYLLGAKKALDFFIEHNVRVAVLKYRSPSCGNDGIYDGTFSHVLIDGQGVFAKKCEEHGIQVFNELQINEFLKYIGKEDDYGTYFKDSASF